jgi:competence protein ComEA
VKHIAALLVATAVWCSTDARALELNSASLAQLEALSGVGTALAARMVEERERRQFTDWDDVRGRLKGMGPKVAVRLSDQGLTVNGAAYAPDPRRRLAAPASGAR